MGRPEQRERNRKRSAANCQRIDSLLAPAEKRPRQPENLQSSSIEDDQESLPLSSAVSRPASESSCITSTTGSELCQDDALPASQEQDSTGEENGDTGASDQGEAEEATEAFAGRYEGRADRVQKIRLPRNLSQLACVQALAISRENLS